jgi:hypothetical protein
VEGGRILGTPDPKKASPDLPKDYADPVREFVDPALEQYFKKPGEQPTPCQDGQVPKLNVVVMIVGTRGAISSESHILNLTIECQEIYSRSWRLERSY